MDLLFRLSQMERSYFYLEVPILANTCSAARFGGKKPMKRGHNHWNVAAWELQVKQQQGDQKLQVWNRATAALTSPSRRCGYLVNWIGVSVVRHPRPPDHWVFCPAGVPHHQLPAEQATSKDEEKTSEV